MTAQQSIAQPGVRIRGLVGPIRRHTVAWLLVLLVGFGLQVFWRLHLSLPLTGPVAHGDEDGYMLGARVLSGGPTATLPQWSIMRPMGYPLLLAPIYWFVQKPDQVYAGVHIVNALLMALNFPLLYLFGRRLFGCGRVWSAAIAFVLATLPSLVFFSQFALTDALVPELLMVILLAIHAMVTGRHPIAYGIVGGAAAGYAANTHVRGLVMLVVLGGVVALGGWRRWFGKGTAIATGSAALLVFGLGYEINSWLEKILFPTGAVTVDSRVYTRLTTLGGLFRVLADGAGQIWHLCTSTYGLAGLGLAAAVIMLVRREGPRATRIVIGSALVMNLGIALATAAGIPDEGRVNNHVYGRYVAMFAGVWSLVAVVALARASWRRSALLVAGGSAIVFAAVGLVWLYAHNKMRHEKFVNFDAPELSFLSGDYKHLHVRWMTAAAVGFMVLFALLLTGWRAARAWDPAATGGRRWFAFVALAGTLVLNLVAMVGITNNISASWETDQYHPGPAQLVRDAHVVPGSTIAQADNLPWGINQRQQREVYWAPLIGFDPTKGAPASRPLYVIATTGNHRATDWPGRRYGYVATFRYRET
ncbi:MAG: glycosyltransferase family 39 protein, partial [Betaproteobacteria bacterium]